MRSSKQQTGTKVKKAKGKRVSLRCPLSIERTDLEYNYDASALQVCMTVENMGGGGLASDTVESAVIVVRLFDADGKIHPCKDNEYFAKLLRFGEEGLASGARITFRLLPDCEGGIRVEDTEIYISRLRYTDGTVTDYVRGDFFDLPGEGVLLTKKFKKDADSAVEALGEGAVYVPERLTEIVWRCTCGEFSESDTCPTCNRNKGELFAAFDALVAPKKSKKAVVAAPLPVSDDTPAAPATDTSEPLPPASDQTAEYSTASTKAALAAMEAENGGPLGQTQSADTDEDEEQPVRPQQPTAPDKTRTILLVSITAASVVLFTVVLLLILTLCSNPGSGDSTTTDAPQTQPPTQDAAAAEKIVRSYLAQNDFSNALGYANLSGCPQSLIDEIYAAAIQYYTSTNQLDQALEWAKQTGDAATVETVNILRFSERLTAGDYIAAMEIAQSLTERKEECIAQAAEGYVNSLVAQGKYQEAMAAADQYNTALTSAKIAETAVQSHLAKNEYEQAIALAKSMKQQSLVITAASAATDYYKAQGDFDKAAEYVSLTGNTAKMQEILDQLTDTQLRRHLPAFFSLLSFADMQKVSATPLSAQPKAVAAIDPLGNVYLGDKKVYSSEIIIEGVDPETEEPTYDVQYLPAVSVSCCDSAVVILLSDGTLRIVEDTNNSYGQENVEGWTDIVAIAAGNYHLLALTKDGTVLAVGSNLNGQCDTAALRDAVAIAVGDNHSLILHKDGTVTALGNNIAGICNTSGWTDIIAIAAGTLHSIGLKSDGTVVALGNCNVDGWNDVIAIFSNATNAVAMKADGTLLFSASGKPSDTLSEITDALWVGVGKQAIVVLHKDGTLDVPGTVNLELPSAWQTEVFGIE